MDTSETYIKMCDDVDLQLALRKLMNIPEDWSNWCATHNRPYYDHNDRGQKKLEGECKGLILPGQDQIQEIMRWEKEPTVQLLDRFHSWVLECSIRELIIHSNTSMEQLWLAFYMKEKHNKLWDGDKWVDQASN